MPELGHVNQLTKYRRSRCSSCQKDCCLLPNIHMPANSYGGNQDWFKECCQDSWSALRTCGIIALLNQFASLALAYPEAEALLPAKGLPETKEDFCEWAYTLRPYIWPGAMGLPKGKSIRQGAIAYAKDRGVQIKWNTLFSRPDLQTELDFIHAGLAAKVPVAHLVWKSQFEDLTWHWIAITGLETDPLDCSNLTEEFKAEHRGDVYVTVSNFGMKEAYPLEMIREVHPLHRELQYPVLVGKAS